MTNAAHARPRMQTMKPRTPQPNYQVIYCHPCTKELADVIRPYFEKGEIPDDLETPVPALAYTYAVFMVQSLPVSLPVCVRHFLEVTKPSSILTP